MDEILIILLTIILSAFFSGMEIAFVSSNKLRLELDRKQGGFGSGIIKIFTDNPGQYIATMLIGNNIALVVYGLIFSRKLEPVLTPIFNSDVMVLVINTIISTAIILLVAEFLPKTTFIISPVFFLKVLSIPTLFFYILLYPISKTMVALSNCAIRILFNSGKEGKKDDENLVFTKFDLDHLVRSTEQNPEKKEPLDDNIRIFRNALDFSKVKLRDCMVPRTEIDAVEADSSISYLKDTFIETGHSRILIYIKTIDNIAGYFELKDLYKDPPNIMSMMRKLAIVPETMPANKLLKIFFDEKKSVALVVDEFGGTSGMVTIEDILEEIVGDIEDEHDTNELTEKVVSPGEYIFSARLEVDYLNETYNLKLPEKDDYETLAGMVLYYYGSIPVTNDIVRINDYVLKVLRATSTRLELINLKSV